ncbi:hypothetical protein A0O21_03685 [Streptococcus pantholopis]|uniref:Uncharacterized protein n=1 Tax=Streptococcus pantholopis TaxID=1811193 RepID=A0A172Q6X1_9STRE|nr:hypothetical protein A0O21_03685 [Streptococcus pantholopis]
MNPERFEVRLYSQSSHIRMSPYASYDCVSFFPQRLARVQFHQDTKGVQAHSKNRKTGEKTSVFRKFYLFCKELSPCSIPPRYKARQKSKAKIGDWTKSPQGSKTGYLFCTALRACSIPPRYKARQKSKAKRR